MPDDIPEELERELMRRSNVMWEETILPMYQAVWASRRTDGDIRKMVADLLFEGAIASIKRDHQST